MLEKKEKSTWIYLKIVYHFTYKIRAKTVEETKVRIENPVKVNNDQIITVLAKLVNGDLKVNGFDLEETIGKVITSFFQR